MSAAFRLATDSCCDLPAALAEELRVEVLSFPFVLDGAEFLDDLGCTTPATEFYGRMRAGATPTTAQVPLAAYVACFEAAADAGVPLVFLSFSSALSGTYDAALVSAGIVREGRPDAELHIIDTRSASAAQALLVREAAGRRDQGAEAAELAEWVERAKLQVNGYFTVETLDHLERGGRVHAAVAATASVLDVRPVLRLSAKGELAYDRGVRGRRRSLRALAEAFEARANGPTAICIGHADAPDDARALEDMIRQRGEVTDASYVDIGPVIGAHAGPGMVAVSFFGRSRRDA